MCHINWADKNRTFLDVLFILFTVTNHFCVIIWFYPISIEKERDTRRKRKMKWETETEMRTIIGSSGPRNGKRAEVLEKFHRFKKKNSWAKIQQTISVPLSYSPAPGQGSRTERRKKGSWCSHIKTASQWPLC